MSLGNCRVSRLGGRGRGFEVEVEVKKSRSRSEEVGQAGRKASWVRVSNSARDFIGSMAVVE